MEAIRSTNVTKNADKGQSAVLEKARLLASQQAELDNWSLLLKRPVKGFDELGMFALDTENPDIDTSGWIF